MNESENSTSAKGSKLLMQKIANEQSAILNKSLGDVLEWISPIKDGSKKPYKEYQLNGPICKELGYQKGVFNGFWPSRQPQWDGIAIGESGTLYLFEAKSHKGEISKRKKRNPVKENEKTKKNDVIIEDSIMRAADSLFKVKKDNETIKTWCLDYYQIGNRIAFLNKMSVIDCLRNNRKIRKVWLVFLLFCNDPTWKDSLDEKGWKNYLKETFNTLGISESKTCHELLPILEDKNIKLLFPDAKSLISG